VSWACRGRVVDVSWALSWTCRGQSRVPRTVPLQLRLPTPTPYCYLLTAAATILPASPLHRSSPAAPPIPSTKTRGTPSPNHDLRREIAPEMTISVARGTPSHLVTDAECACITSLVDATRGAARHPVRREPRRAAASASAAASAAAPREAAQLRRRERRRAWSVGRDEDGSAVEAEGKGNLPPHAALGAAHPLREGRASDGA